MGSVVLFSFPCDLNCSFVREGVSAEVEGRAPFCGASLQVPD